MNPYLLLPSNVFRKMYVFFLGFNLSVWYGLIIPSGQNKVYLLFWCGQNKVKKSEPGVTVHTSDACVHTEKSPAKLHFMSSHSCLVRLMVFLIVQDYLSWDIKEASPTICALLIPLSQTAGFLNGAVVDMNFRDFYVLFYNIKYISKYSFHEFWRFYFKSLKPMDLITPNKMCKYPKLLFPTELI